MSSETFEPSHSLHERVEAVRKRYAEEAKKRLNEKGNAQFIQLTRTHEKRLADLVSDPWVDHDKLNSQEPPIKNNELYKFFILGAGFGGLQFAALIIREGVATTKDVRLADQAGGFGGAWYWNRFPGLHCDIESYIYLPMLEETGYIPTSKYAPGAEIREHAERLAAKWDLVDKTLFRSDVKTARWDENSQLWTVKLVQDRGPSLPPIEITFRAQYIYFGAGALSRPQIPDVPGILEFPGPMFHTARWNYKVSGGSQEDQTLTGFMGKRVAVVGTAATSIAIVPEIAKFAKELFVIQRTPAHVKPRDQRPTDIENFKKKVAYKKNWQRERQLNFTKFLTNGADLEDVDLVNDSWTNVRGYSARTGSSRNGLPGTSPGDLGNHLTNFHILDYPEMQAVRDRVDRLVHDRETAEKLKPWYPSWCKRPTFSDTYLQTFNLPNVHLVDTDGKGPSKATEKGLVVGGKEYPFDIIIFGTGYETPGAGSSSPAKRTGVEVTGRDSSSLDQKWLDKGSTTLHGYATSGFPNLFFSGVNQGTFTGNDAFMLGLIAQNVTFIIAAAERRVGPSHRAVIEVTREGEEAHTAEILKRAPYFSVFAGCTPGFFNNFGEGAKVSDPKEQEKNARAASWSEGTSSFLDYIRRWQEEGSLKGLSVTGLSDARFNHGSRL